VKERKGMEVTAGCRQMELIWASNHHAENMLNINRGKRHGPLTIMQKIYKTHVETAD
jgi:hypothetical protein